MVLDHQDRSWSNVLRPTAGPREHGLRYALTNEAHARPFTSLASPVRGSHLALLSGEDGYAADYRHIAMLCERFGLRPPPDGAKHLEEELPLPGEQGRYRLRWERHTEFCTYTLFRKGPFGDPFADPVIDALPRDWLDTLPGDVLVALHLAVLAPDTPPPSQEDLHGHFFAESLAGSVKAGGTAMAWSDFRIHADGFARLLILDRGLGERQMGRLVQRLLEVETYRMMALLALPLAREIAPRIAKVETELAGIIEAMSGTERTDDQHRLLGRLLHMAAESERIAAATDYRFGASRAYYALVRQRIGELREQRIEGLQTIEEFMARRLDPAMQTCEATARRQQDLLQRVTRAGNLLRTRVDVALEAQNQALLQSMDRRARAQLRLQETVEGLSVVAISYYAMGLLSYLARAGNDMGLDIHPNLLMAAAFPFIVMAVWFGVRRMRRAVLGDEKERRS